MVTKDKKWWTFEVLGPSMIYNRFNREISCHHITVSLHHRITVSVSHLPCPLPPNQSVICLAPCHQTSQSFALPPTTTSPRHRITVLVSHLPCPLPPNQSVICLAPYHRILHHCITALVSHLPCPLPPSQSVICLAPCHQTSQSFALSPTTASPCHCVTASPCHRITALVSHLPCPLPPSQSVICLTPCHQTSQSFALPPTTASLPQIFPTTWVWIWLVNANQHSSDWLIVPTTANQITGIEKPNYHKTLIFFPTTSLKWSHEARIDELADSNEPANIEECKNYTCWLVFVYHPCPLRAPYAPLMCPYVPLCAPSLHTLTCPFLMHPLQVADWLRVPTRAN